MFTSIAKAYFLSIQVIVNRSLDFVSFFTERGFKYSIRKGALFHGTTCTKVRAVKQLILDTSESPNPKGVLFHWQEVNDVPYGISLEQRNGEELYFKSPRTYVNGWIQDWYVCSQSSLIYHFLPTMTKRPIMLVFETQEFQCQIFLESVCRVPGTILVREIPGFEKILLLLDEQILSMAEFAHLTLALIGLQVQRAKPLRVLVSYPSLMRDDILSHFSHNHPNVKSTRFESPSRSMVKIGIKSPEAPRPTYEQGEVNNKQSFLLLQLKSWLRSFLTGVEADSNASQKQPTQVSFVFTLIVKLEELCLRPAHVISRFLKAFSVFLEHTITVLEHFIQVHRTAPDYDNNNALFPES